MFPLKNTEAYIHANGFRSTLGKELADRDAEISELGSEIQALTNYVAENNVKNLLPNNLVSQTITSNDANLTVAVNNGIVTLNGSTGTRSISLKICDIVSNSQIQLATLFGKTVKMSGCPSGGNSSTYYLNFYRNKSGESNDDFGNGKTFDVENDGEAWVNVSIVLAAGQTLSNLVFKPMITLSDIPDSDYAHYQPYAKTNVELTQELPQIESGTTAFTDGNEKVNFSKAFSTAPNVIAILKYTTVTTGETPLLLKVYDVTTTYFRVRAIDNTGANVSSFTNATSFMWQAMS